MKATNIKATMTEVQAKVCRHAVTSGCAGSVSNLISTEAGRYRIAKNWDLWSDYADEDVSCPFEQPEPVELWNNDHPECSLLLFADGSLYYANNAENEVWADAQDFCTECGLDRLATEFSGSDTHRLAVHLGLYES